MNELIKLLNTIHPLSDNALTYLSVNMKQKVLHKKGFFLRKGHISKDVCFVQKGLLRCFYYLDDKEVSSWFKKEGDIVMSGESFYQQTKSYESIQVLEECILYYVTYEELQYMYRNFTDLNFIARILTERYYILNEQRLYAMRMRTASEKYIYLMDYHPELILRVLQNF